MTGDAPSAKRWPWRWHVAQAGAREHYAVPRAMHLTSRLETLYTSSWCRRGAGFLRKGPMFVRAFAGHHQPEVPSDRVVSFNLGSAAWAVHRGMWAKPKTVEQVYRWEVDNSEWFGNRVWRHLKRRRLEAGADCFFGYQSECLEVLEPLREQKIVTVLDLAGPGEVEDNLVNQEAERWSGWASIEPTIPSFYYDRVREEWSAADIVLVNSEWSRSAWIQQGVPAEKIVVVPLAYEPPKSAPRSHQSSGGPLTVLWLGSVILRKGIPYLIEAARLLAGSNVRFVVAGPIGISRDAVASAPKNMEFIGRVARGQAVSLYRNADVFVLPTISDGFAITQLEAMAQGVPVITTPNCGKVVTDGMDGLIVPAADAESLAAAVARLEQNRPLLEEMSRQALIKSRQFGVLRFGESLNAAVSAFRQGAPLQ